MPTKRQGRPQLKPAELAPYQVLGVSPKASPAEVTAAYKVLAQIFHPDRFVQSPDTVRREAEQRMRELNEAYALARKGHLIAKPPSSNGSPTAPGYGPGSAAWSGVPWHEACRRRASEMAKAEQARKERERAAPSGNAIPENRRGRIYPSILTGQGLARHTNNITCKRCRTLVWLPPGWQQSLDDTVYYCPGCRHLVLAR
jgi:curved DNA-binding protein CbpA